MPDIPSSVLVTLLATLLGGGGLVAFLLWPTQRDQMAVKTLRDALEIVAEERDHHLKRCADATSKYDRCRGQKLALEALASRLGATATDIQEALK